MVRDEEDDRLLPGGVQHVQNLADLFIQVGDIGEIGAAGFADVFFGDVKTAPVIGVKNALRMRVLIVVTQIGDLGQQMLAILIQVPVFPTRHVRIMRMGEADGHAPRATVLAPRQIIKLGACVVGDLVIIFHLVRDFGHARPRDRTHVVIPPVDPLARFAIVGRPTEIGGVDIGGQAVLEPVQLVGTDEMHLAGQAGVISRPPQMVRIGGDVAAELGGVVIDAGARGQLPGHETGPPRRAKRRRGIGVGKARRPFCKPFQVGRMQPVGGTIRKEGSVQLIHHQDQNVRLCHFSASSRVFRTRSAWLTASCGSFGALRAARM